MIGSVVDILFIVRCVHARLVLRGQRSEESIHRISSEELLSVPVANRVKRHSVRQRSLDLFLLISVIFTEFSISFQWSDIFSICYIGMYIKYMNVSLDHLVVFGWLPEILFPDWKFMRLIALREDTGGQSDFSRHYRIFQIGDRLRDKAPCSRFEFETKYGYKFCLNFRPTHEKQILRMGRISQSTNRIFHSSYYQQE